MELIKFYRFIESLEIIDIYFLSTLIHNQGVKITLKVGDRSMNCYLTCWKSLDVDMKLKLGNLVLLNYNLVM